MDGQQVLKELLEEIAVEQKYVDPDIDIKPISSGGANYTSELYLATIKSDKKEKLDLFAKVAVVGKELREQINADRIFETERFFYTKLVNTYNDILEKKNVPEEERIVFPKFYGYKDTYLKDTVVLENLVAKGYTNFNRFKSVDWEYASATIVEMAKFHALSFAYREENPKEYEDVCEQLLFDMGKIDIGDRWVAMCQGSFQVLNEEQTVKVQKLLEEFKDMKAFMKLYSPYKTPVLLHGDFRPSNMLSKIENGKQHIIPVDYQTVCTGRPTRDLLYFIFLGSDRAFRKQHYDDCIQLYYERLTVELNTLGINVNKVYPREEYEEELEATSKYGLLVGMFILPIITVEAENAPKFADSLEDFVIKPNEMYAERLLGIVQDYTDWGYLK